MDKKSGIVGIFISILLFSITYAIEKILDKFFEKDTHFYILFLVISFCCIIYFVFAIAQVHYEKILKEIKKKNNKSNNELFEISLGLNANNNARFSILEKAAKDNHDVYAAATLANLYRCGVILSKNPEKALELYQCVKDYDTTGLIYWCIGWMYENDFLGVPNKKKALQYYTKSMDLGYAKAYNSVGKFLNYGIECQKDVIRAGEMYLKAAKLGDINAMLNAAFLYEKDKSQVKIAEKNFLKAIEYGSHFGILRLGKLYMDNPDIFNKSTQEVANIIIESINSKGLTLVQEACAYFWLAKILALDNNVNISKLSNKEIKNSSQYCFLKSYNILYSLNESGDLKDNNTAVEIWNSLSESINVNLKNSANFTTLF